MRHMLFCLKPLLLYVGKSFFSNVILLVEYQMHKLAFCFMFAIYAC